AGRAGGARPPLPARAARRPDRAGDRPLARTAKAVRATRRLPAEGVMIALSLSYAAPSTVSVNGDTVSLGLCGDERRRVRFRARVQREALFLRLALQALASVVWSYDRFDHDGEYIDFSLDPVVTVHPDRVIFEAFSPNLSACARVEADRDIFAPEGEV